MFLTKVNEIRDNISQIVVIRKAAELDDFGFNSKELEYINNCINDEKNIIEINRYDKLYIIYLLADEENSDKVNEKARKAGVKIQKRLNELKIQDILINDISDNKDETLALTEGLVLSNYQFLKYLEDKDKKKNSLRHFEVYGNSIDSGEVDKLHIGIHAVYYARDLVNEPQNYMTSLQIADEIKKLSSESGFKVEVFEKEKIEELKMGGVLAVNQGSVIPPTFSVMTWKPDNAKNSKPYVLVGKGIVYDTGGLSLKPTADSMDSMKSDMGGAAAVIGLMYAIAKAKLPIHVVGLVPATDNRPDGNAYAPGDIITMMNGKTVEVLNTDAEGRLVLADALHYSNRFSPELVIDLATLTGAAEKAIGNFAIVGMGNADQKEVDNLKKSGWKTYERIAEFPFWEEYGDMMKSDIADLKNLGGKFAGMITAGKFLENFTDFPYIHLDIAGPAFLKSDEAYNTKGGTGSGIRVLYDFFRNKAGE